MENYMPLLFLMMMEREPNMWSARYKALLAILLGGAYQRILAIIRIPAQFMVRVIGQ